MTPAYDGSGVPSVLIGVDAGARSLREADHWIRELPLPEAALACTHLIRTAEWRGVAVSLWLPDEPSATRVLAAAPVLSLTSGAARQAAEEAAGRRAGRAVVYPGWDRVTDRMTVAELLSETAVERLRVVGGPADPDPGTVLWTRGHVRPEWYEGRLTLAVVPAVGGMLAPFEVPNPTPCCADHLG